ncbi:Crp/Fnr family transcriptional regulator [Mesorhizobium sp. SP-1A]|uniref:Crp/Fnr family transcriptional regulator n=1 Tax=Mesorhizobium sp. SP-1A TaxID=3077840 RepID=UPI0028F739C5|nr:Crp/Fnr family transcriptional regulator [Mesorhizobium sp. SP-1A]
MQRTLTGEPDALAKKLEAFLPTAVERALLNEFTGVKRRVGAREELDTEKSAHTAYLLHRGWACVYKLLPDGNRQIVDFRLPGDFVGLIGLMLQKPDRHLETMTEAIISEINVNRLMATIYKSPILGEGLLWSLSRDAAIMGEHIVNLGRRTALERTAHLMLELGQRLAQIGHSSPTAYECPLTQKDLADALGITNVHLNRVLRTLRDDELITFNGHAVTVHNPQALARLAGFDPAFLFPARKAG